MTLKKLREIIKGLPGKIKVTTGNATGHLSPVMIDDPKILNIYPDSENIIDLDLQLSKRKKDIQELIIWGEE